MPMHNIDPIWNKESEILILGSFPSVKSREASFYYAHPQNRFWRVLSTLYAEPMPGSTEEKRSLLLRHHLALWDVIASCEIEGSSDSSLRNVEANDIAPLIAGSQIRRVYANGATAGRLYRQHLLSKTGIPAVTLPSTSPANASFSFEKLCLAWRVLLS